MGFAPLAVASSAMSGLAMGAFWAMTPVYVSQLGFAAAEVGLAFSLYPLAVAQLIDQLHADEIVSGSADMLVMHGVGSAVAPLLVGVVMNIFGGHGLPPLRTLSRWYLPVGKLWR